MTLAPVVLEIICSHAFIGVKCESQERESIQSSIEQILPKFNQVVYTSNTICKLNTMTLAQVFFLDVLFTSFHWLTMKKVRKGRLFTHGLS